VAAGVLGKAGEIREGKFAEELRGAIVTIMAASRDRRQIALGPVRVFPESVDPAMEARTTLRVPGLKSW